VGVLPNGVERQGAGVVASAVLFDVVEVGEQCGHGGGPVAVDPGASCGNELNVAAGHGGGRVVWLTTVMVVVALVSSEVVSCRDGR
jgi:hypothetical protein